MRRRLLSSIQLPALARTHGPVIVFALFGFFSSALSIGLIALAALWAREPLVFPSLGPTAFLIFDRPRSAAAAPRNIVLGHLLGVGAGYGSLLVFGLAHAGPALEHVTLQRVGAAALSLGVTVAVMVASGIPHPPAAATTLIVSLGLLTRLPQLTALMAAVVTLATQGVVIDRVVGLDYPLWASRRPPPLP